MLFDQPAIKFGSKLLIINFPNSNQDMMQFTHNITLTAKPLCLPLPAPTAGPASQTLKHYCCICMCVWAWGRAAVSKQILPLSSNARSDHKAVWVHTKYLPPEGSKTRISI